MLVTSLLLVAMAQSLTATVDNTRVAFTKCLSTDLRKSLEAKKTPAEYEMAQKSVCESERAAFRNAVIALDKSAGDSDADATDSADMQVEDYHANFLEKYKDYSDTGTMPAS